MITETPKEKRPEIKETKEITFKCKFCSKSWPIDEMKVLNRFFPPIIACRDCERKMR